MNEKTITLMLVDDQYLFLESLKVVIESIDSQMKVLQTAQNGKEALEKLSEKKVDCILMDVRMPLMDGVTSVKIIHEKWPSISIIMLTTFEDDTYVMEAMQNGAKGYLLKNIAPHMLVSGIRAVCNGSILMDPDIAGSLMNMILQNKSKSKSITGKDIPFWFFDLTIKEREIVKHIMLGKTNTEIAQDINVGAQTIRNYISSLYKKLDVPDRKSLMKKVSILPPSLFSSKI